MYVPGRSRVHTTLTSQLRYRLYTDARSTPVRSARNAVKLLQLGARAAVTYTVIDSIDCCINSRANFIDHVKNYWE